MPEQNMIKVLLADDHKIVREGLRRIIEESGEMTVVGEASSGDEAIRKTLKFKPDVAVVDIAMPPGMDGLEVVARLKDQAPKVPVLILTMHDEDQYVVRAVEAGAMGYVTKQAAAEQLVDAVKKLHSGGRYLTEKASEALALRVLHGESRKSAVESLSMRELQVMRKLSLGQTNHEIAESYHISVKTVDTYRSRILKKLNLRNNAELSRFAIQNKIIDI